VTFASDDARKEELERLAGLSDEAFAATEAAFDRYPPPKTEPDGGSQPPAAPPAAMASRATKPLRTEAGIRPHDVDDQPSESLETKLRKGLLAAYQNRVGAPAPPAN